MGEKKAMQLKKGDRVFMNNRYEVPMKYKGKIFTVSNGPQNIGGTECVWLEGYKGCYSVDGLFKIADKPKKSSRTEKKDEQNKKGTVQDY